jgi:2-haloacid dehalogenase
MDVVPAPRREGRVSAVVFDLGGVLIDWDPRHLYRKVFAGDEAAMEAFLATICTPEWNHQQDAGRPWADAVASLVRAFPAEREQIVAFHERWPETLGGSIEGTVAIVEELHARGMPIYALSNWSAETFPTTRGRFPFLGLFDGIVISGEERLAKPDPRLFGVLFERYGLDPHTSVFIDDLEQNISAAAEVGMLALRFVGPAALRDDLRDLGLLDGSVTARADVAGQP